MHDFPITTPPNTTKASPLRTELPLLAGLIDQVQIAFPPGPQGLLHVTITRGSSLLWPVNEGDGFASDAFTIDFNPRLILADEPLDLAALTWNDDDSFSHQVNVRINVVDPELALGISPELGILQRLERTLFGRRGSS